MANRGTLRNTITGIQGVVPGGTAQITISGNKRVHRVTLQCTGIAYTTPVLTIPAAGLGASEVQPTFNVVVTAGVITGVTVASDPGDLVAGTYTAIVTDPSGGDYGAVVALGVSSVPALSVTGITSGGSVAPVPPSVFTGPTPLIQGVNGVPVRDITTDLILRVNGARGNDTDGGIVTPGLGDLNLFYTEPQDRFLRHNTVRVWDLWGTGPLQFSVPVTKNITSPAIIGEYTYDADPRLRNTNTRKVNGQAVTTIPLHAIGQHAQTWTLNAGLNTINNIGLTVLGVPLKFIAFWLLGSSPGNLQQVQLRADNNPIVDLTPVDVVNRDLASDGFNVEPYFDTAFVFDKGRRVGQALTCNNSLDIYVYSAVQQTLTIVRETDPGVFAGG